MKIVLDTDIGDDIDDAFALALLTRLPNVELLGVTTTFGQTRERAEIAAKLLKALGRPDVPVYAGRRGAAPIRRQYDWARGFRSPSLRAEPAVEFLRRVVERAPGRVTLIPVGPLVNIGDLVTRYPQTRAKIGRIVLMGGAVHVGYNNQPPAVPEWNIKCDPTAARAVFESGVPLVMAGLEATAMMQLDAERQKRIFGVGTPGTDALAALTALWGGATPTLFDPVAVAHALGHRFADEEPRRVVVESDGLTRLADGRTNARVLVRPRRDAFLDWFVAALDSGTPREGTRQTGGETGGRK